MFINRKSNRLIDYDYSMPGGYFVTINVRDRLGDRNIFGEIIDGKMILNKWGEIIKQQWEWLFMQYPYLMIDEYIIIPDHVHGIIIITLGNGRDRSLCDKNYI
jgi:putative transposase